MAAGGGRGTGSLFSGEGVDQLEINLNGTLRLDEVNLGAVAGNAHGHGPMNGLPRAAAANTRTRQLQARGNTESGSESGSEISAATSMESGVTDGTASRSGSEVSGSAAGVQPSGERNGGAVGGVLDGEVWAGGMSCVVGLQKRGLRGLMEGRRMRERSGRGGAVNGVGGASGGGGG